MQSAITNPNNPLHTHKHKLTHTSTTSKYTQRNCWGVTAECEVCKYAEVIDLGYPAGSRNDFISLCAASDERKKLYTL